MTKHFEGVWLAEEIPNEFSKVMKALGYSKLERHYAKKAKIYVHSKIDGDKLTLELKSPMYNTIKSYLLNSEVVEFEDERKNKLIEITTLLDEHNVQTQTIYPDRNLTIIETRHFKSTEVCIHKIQAIPEGKEQVTAEMIYRKIKEN